MTINFNELKVLLNNFAETLIKSGAINSTFINSAIVNKSNIETANEIFKTVEESQEIGELVSILHQDENKIIKRAFVFAVLLTNITQEKKRVELLDLLVEENDLNEEKKDLSKSNNNNVENSALANLTAYLNIAIDTHSPQIVELLVERKNADIDIETNFSVALDMADRSLDETTHQMKPEPISPEKQEKALEVLKCLSKELIKIDYRNVPFIVEALAKSPYQKVREIPGQIFSEKIDANAGKILSILPILETLIENESPLFEHLLQYTLKPMLPADRSFDNPLGLLRAIISHELGQEKGFAFSTLR